LAYIDYAIVLKAQLNTLQQINTAILNNKKNIEKLQKDLNNLAETQRKERQMGKTGLVKIKKLITNEQIPLLLKEISDLANQHQVRIMQLRPEKGEKDTKSAKIAKAQNLIGEKINLDLSCDYHRLGQFLNAIENSEVYLELEDMKISSVANDYFRQNVRLVLKTYVKE
jgi:Tfp pilus assembly protein PilO